MAKVIVIGANGQLGSDIALALETYGHEVAKLTHADIEISDAASVAQALDGYQPDVLVNTAAFHNVPKCEDEPETAFKINALGSKILAEGCQKNGVYFVHMSTDYVFDGKKMAPYLESDRPVPLNVYGNTKLAGEHFVEAICQQSAIMRVSGIYGAMPCRAKGGLNFVKMMLKLASEREFLRVVDDEFLTPTSTAEIGRQVAAVIETRPTGVLHATAQGQCSWYEFARAIFDITQTKIDLQKAQPGEFAAGVNRPKYSVLENAALKAAGIDVLRHWRDGLTDYLTSEGLAK